MEKGDQPDLFVNDGSFFEKFKNLQQEKIGTTETRSSAPASSIAPAKLSAIPNKRPLDLKGNDAKKANTTVPGAKLAFSLKQKSKLPVASVKFVADEEDGGEVLHVRHLPGDETAKRQLLLQSDAKEISLGHEDIAPSPPNDPAVRKVADKLASFVAKHGRQFEHVTRQRNPGDTPFKFLFDSSCSDYKYYEYRLLEEEKALAESKEPQAPTMGTSTARASSSSQKNVMQQQPNYQTPASALYGTYEETEPTGESGSASDSIAMMELYMKKAAREEQKRQPKQSKDEMPPPAYLQGASTKKGHHMGDYIPPEELDKFLASCNDATAVKAATGAADRARIQADNIGHKLLSKMGWKEGEGLGSDRSGRADPVMAGSVKKDNLGVGAHNPGEVTPEDDIYEQYKKRMMLGYRHRPNPMNNPRKAYY